MDPSQLKPLENSWISIDHTDKGHPRLSWLPTEGYDLGRWAVAGFLSFWLCGWVAGECFAAWALFNMVFLGGMGGFQWLTALFLTGWLGAWTIGGLGAMAALYGILRTQQPERIILTEHVLIHEPGSLRTWNVRHSNLDQRPRLFGNRQRQIPWSEITNIRVEPYLGDQRLTIDHGAERIEIGRGLREPEREWLAQVLRTWAGLPALEKT